jgi:peptidoglycan/LPS O-acetylase OafA/YrhL
MPNHDPKPKFSFFSNPVAVPDFLKQTYYRPLDGFRGIAILIVVFAHIGLNHYTRSAALFIDSRFGVHLFFVLSGFLITTLLMKEKIMTERISLRYFYTRRLLKIVPVAYLFLLVTIALNQFYHLKIHSSDFLTSFFFLKNLAFKSESPFTAHFWTLAVEEQFYLIFPALLAASINKYFYTALSIVVVVPLVAILGHFQILDPQNLVVKVLMYLFWKGPVMILIGSLWAILIFKGAPANLRISKYYLIDFMLFVAAIVIENKYFIGYVPYVSELVSALLSAYVLASVLKNRNLLTMLLEKKVLVNIGIISYSVYIWQQLFIGVRAWEPWLISLRSLPLCGLILIKLVLVFVIGFFSWQLVEKKSLKLKARFR